MGRSRASGRERERSMQTITSCNSCNSAGCRSCRPGPLGDWSHLDADHARVLGALISEQFHARGDTVFRTGASSGGIYCIAEGIVGLRLLHENGTSVLVDIAYPGDLIGTRAFLRNGRHRTTAEALSEVRLCRIPGSEARRLMHDHPALHQRLVRVCLDSLDASQEAMVQAAALPNRDRLFHLLSRLLGHCGATDSAGRVQAQLPISREDIAGMLGVRQETLSRLLKRLKQEGVIDISGRQCQLLSLRPLKPAPPIADRSHPLALRRI